MPKALLDPLPRILTLGSLNLLAGASGVGKTALIAELARRFRDGEPIFGHASHVPPAIGYITADRPWADAHQWFTAVGFPDIKQYSIVDDHTLSTLKIRKRFDRTKLLIECIEKLQLPRGSLIFVDPIALFLGGNLLDYDTVAIACIEIHRYCLLHDYCLVGLAHSSKQKATQADRYMRPQDRISGSMALLGYTGTQMYLMSPEEAGPKETYFTFHWNPHHSKPETFNLAKDARGLFKGVELGGAGDPDLDLTLEYDKETLRIQASIPEAPLHTSTVQLIAHHTQAGPDAISRATLFRRLDLLVKRGDVVQPARGQWQRPIPTPAN